MAKRNNYTDVFRSGAVLQWEANPNYLLVASNLGIPESTLRSWVNRKLALDKQPQGAELDAVVYDENKIDFIATIDNEIKHIFGEMDLKRQDAPYRDLGVVYGILQDKRQLLTGGPTENQSKRILIKYVDPD